MPDKPPQATNTDPKFVAGRAALRSAVRQWRRQDKRLVFTNGCFDILHSGHVACLTQARTHGDVLIVGLNSDASVRRLKGPDRPINSLNDRARVLCGLSAVDAVTPFGSDTPEQLITIIRPDVYVKGGDYTPESLPEAGIIMRFGGEVIIVPLVANRSTSNIIARARLAAKPQHHGANK